MVSLIQPRLQGGVTTRQALRFVLIAQGLLAALLVITDVGVKTVDDIFVDDELYPNSPISPGDQRRHFEPSQRPPGYLTLPDNPLVPLPAEIPERLEFSLQTVDGFGEIMVINGGLETGDSDRYFAFSASLQSPPDAVAINSPGGIVAEALSIGHMLRKAGLKTLILPGMQCMSACPYMLAGGIEREVSMQAAVGMHQHYYETPSFIPVFWAVKDIQFGQGRTMDFLIEMGVDPSVMLHSLNTPPEDIYILVEEELLKTKLATKMLP